MVDSTDDVWDGVKLMKEYLKPKNLIICIEDNKPQPIKKFKELCAQTGLDKEGVSVRVLPSLYPQGERKVLVYNVTGRIVPEGARLADVGVIVSNVSTVAVISQYIETGLPLVSKVITVDGPSVKTPKNVHAPIGTLIRELFDFCGGFSGGEPRKIIIGGPMMGIAQASLDVPVVKTTNCVIACPQSTTFTPVETACIKCGRCLTKCPMRLMPPNIETACVECGCCAYICPAKRDLVQVVQLSKELLWASNK
jgi:electron transport complex protein RnfC